VKHAAIDLGGKESQICIRRPDGSIEEERKVPTRSLPKLMASWESSRIVMEVCSEAFSIADAAASSGHEVRVVPAQMVRLLGVGDRGVKNDQQDARHLSHASWRTDVPSVHIPSKRSRELKSICGTRDALVETRTKLINTVRGWMRTQLWRIRGGIPSTFPDRVRAHAQTIGQPIPNHIGRQLTVLELVNQEMRGADKDVREIAGNDAVCRRLMAIPGVGPITAVRFVAVIDDPKRFPTAHHVQSYLGLTPGEHSSSDRERKTGITKAGPEQLRRCLVQAAWSAQRVRTIHPMIEWSRRIAERRNNRIAMVALARKLAGIMFALWRDGSSYRPSRSAMSLELA
jgi:transposase